jgi:cadmium resistance protein CadD (predicted permease)
MECAAGSWLVSRRKITRVVERRGHGVVPAVFIAIGVYIFYKAGSHRKHLLPVPRFR